MDYALIGGVLIGLAALLLYAALGRIAGISGIFFGALEPQSRSWRLPFLLGLAVGGWVAFAGGIVAPVPAGVSWPLTMSAGLLVGFGTRLGSGCTSGHGICGLARLSPRSLVAVPVFIGAGMFTATLLRPLLAS